jgi:DNA-binding response OmpR family regulator
MGNQVEVLVVDPNEEDRKLLCTILNHSRFTLVAVGSLAEAQQQLHTDTTFAVILCERTLPDGDWKDVLKLTEIVPVPPLLIVTGREADDYLWAEVLNTGGYDTLQKPLDAEEVVRQVSLGYINWENQWKKARQAS